MAKKTDDTVKKQTDPVFTKEQILASNKYVDRQDAINALWTDDSQKSIADIDKMLSDFYGIKERKGE